MEMLNQISELLQKGKYKEIAALTQEALDSGIPAQEILDGGLLKGMAVVGEKFKNNEIFVPHVLVSARALNNATEILRPKLTAEGVKPVGTAVIGTVKGDLHDIGKNLVKLMLQGAGFVVHDLGVDVPIEKFINAVREYKPDVLALSALLTTTMSEQRNIVEALKITGLRGQVKVVIGGAPVTQSFCEQIGADAYAPDAVTAAEKAKELIA